METLNHNELITRQADIESGALAAGASRYQESSEGRDLSDLPPGQLVIKKTVERVALAITSYIKEISSGKSNRGASKLKFLTMVDAPSLAYLTLTTLLNDSPEKLGTLANRVGRKVEDELNALALRNGCDSEGESLKGLFKFIVEKLAGDGSRHFKRKAIEWQKNKHSIQSIADELGWDEEAKATMGLTLVYIVLENTDLFQIDTIQEKIGNTYKVTNVVHPTTQLLAFLDKTADVCQFLRPVYPPMVVKPIDWSLDLKLQEDSSYSVVHTGGYLSRRLKLDLIKGANTNYLTEAVESGQLAPALEALNYLQSTAWRINPEVYAVVKQLWDEDHAVALPARAPQEEPQKPAGYSEAHAAVTPVFVAWARTNKAALKAQHLSRPAKYALFLKEYPEFSEQMTVVSTWKKAAAAVHAYNQSSDRISTIKDVSMKIRIARDYANYEAIYFPWQFDFRGRAYPATNFLTPQGDSLCKALLDFSEGYPLTNDSAQYLAIHGANCWANDSIDKAPMNDRIQWVKDNEGNILRSAANPIGCKWWTDADGGDNAFVFLAFCFEWARWVEGGEGTLSHLPISSDGSCNGIQHYAALLRSFEDGEAVNLTPGEKPNDIYRRVANFTLKVITGDLSSEEFSQYAQLFHPVLSNPKKARSIVKRATMTTPYAVTQFGIKDQLRKDHKDLFESLGLDKENTKKARSYLADAINRGICEAITAATQGMDFLKKVASAAAKQELPLVWTTPDGFKVQQRYEKFDLLQVKTTFAGSLKLKATVSDVQETDKETTGDTVVFENRKSSIEIEAPKKTVSVTLAKPLGVLNTRKQASAVGPNFIHSLDATHLRMTLRRCEEAGIPAFAAVHDSYGVHAGRFAEMNQLLRAEFVKMHTNSLLEVFRNEVAAMPGMDQDSLPEVPTMGSLELSGVEQSVYFFA